MHHHLYGNLLVLPADPDNWSPVDRELFNLRVPGARMKLVGGGSGLGTAGSATAGVTQQPSSS